MDLKEIKAQIDIRKKEMIKESTSLGENHNLNTPVQTDTILYEIQQSLRTGQANETVDKIKSVDRLAGIKRANKNGSVVNGSGLSEELMQHVETAPSKQTVTQPQQTTRNVNDNRDKLFEQELLKTNNNQGLTDLLKQNESNTSMSMMGNYQQPHQSHSQQLNSNSINEQIDTTVNKYLTENFGVVLQKVMKDAIIEMYSIEKVRESLFENKKYIQEIIRDTLVDLAKEKAKRNK